MIQQTLKFGKNSNIELIQDALKGMFHQVLFENEGEATGGNTLVPKSAYNEWLQETGKLNCDFSVGDDAGQMVCECTMTIEDYYTDVPWQQRYEDMKEYLLILNADLSGFSINTIGFGIHSDLKKGA